MISLVIYLNLKKFNILKYNCLNLNITRFENLPHVVYTKIWYFAEMPPNSCTRCLRKFYCFCGTLAFFLYFHFFFFFFVPYRFGWFYFCFRSKKRTLLTSPGTCIRQKTRFMRISISYAEFYSKLSRAQENFNIFE